jgi:glutamate synthase domain-containing protein 3
MQVNNAMEKKFMIKKNLKIQDIKTKFLSHIKFQKEIMSIDAEDIYYKDLNYLLRNFNGGNIKKVKIHNVCGQRYIGTDLKTNTEIEVFGTPGNDLGAFMNGPKLIIHGNVQDGVGNTMNEGKIIIYGYAGDIAGYSMRGGKIFIRGDVGYRVGIHMKEYNEKMPSIVVGGTAQDFLGEYMAGGRLLVLGLNLKNGFQNIKYVGTGMHGGIMYIRGKVKNLGKEVDTVNIEKKDEQTISSLVTEFCEYFKFDVDDIMSREFTKIIPVSSRPYGQLYAY